MSGKYEKIIGKSVYEATARLFGILESIYFLAFVVSVFFVMIGFLFYRYPNFACYTLLSVATLAMTIAAVSLITVSTYGAYISLLKKVSIWITKQKK